MKKINTVLGAIDPEVLELTLPHEHIVAAYPGWECDPLARPYSMEVVVDVCLKSMGRIKSCGVNAIIDATPVDLSRNVDVMKAVSERLQIHIVCSTGRYTQMEGKWGYFIRRHSSGVGDIETELYEGLMQELVCGIGNTGIRPGIIKIATGFNSISFCEGAMFRAAARASIETGVPIMTHTEDGTMGPEQADLLIGEGVSPQKIAVGHMCGNRSLEYHLDVLKKGVYIAMDRFGIEMIISDEHRIETLINLIHAGYADRIMISQDCYAASYGRGGRTPSHQAIKFRNWSFTNIFDNIIPALKRSGISDGHLKTIMVENPRRFLSDLQIPGETL